MRKPPNRSAAVMAQRKSPPDVLDDWPTPHWATRALCERIDIDGATIWEPACNRGYMVHALSEYNPLCIVGSDIFPYYEGAREIDFLSVGSGLIKVDAPNCDWVITNPPFKCLSEFLRIALAHAKTGVAFLARIQAMEGNDRYEEFWSRGILTKFMPFVERVNIVPGQLDIDGSFPMSYAWYVFIHGAAAEPPQWIAPCRDRLERDSDYGAR